MKLYQVIKPLLENKVDFILNNQAEKLFSAHMLDTGVSTMTIPLADGPVKATQEQIDNVAEFVLKRLEMVDPTPNNKYLQWLANQYIKRNFFLEDGANILSALADFHTHKNNLEKKDINQYKTVSELTQVLRPFRETDADSTKEQKLLAEGQAEIIYDDGNNIILVPKTEEASRYYAKEKFATEWCTAYPDNFNEYSKAGPLYIIIDDVNDEVYQVHFDSDEDAEIIGDDDNHFLFASDLFMTKPWQVKDINDDEVEPRNAFYTDNTAFAWLVEERITYLENKNAASTYNLFELLYLKDLELIDCHSFITTLEQNPDSFKVLLDTILGNDSNPVELFDIIRKDELIDIYIQNHESDIEQYGSVYHLSSDVLMHTVRISGYGMYNTLYHYLNNLTDELSAVSLDSMEFSQVEPSNEDYFISEIKNNIQENTELEEELESISNIDDLLEYLDYNQHADKHLSSIVSTFENEYELILNNKYKEEVLELVNTKLKYIDIHYDETTDSYEISTDLAFDICFNLDREDKSIDLSIDEIHDFIINEISQSVEFDEFIRETLNALQ